MISLSQVIEIEKAVNWMSVTPLQHLQMNNDFE